MKSGSSARKFHNAVFDALAPPQTFRAFNNSRFEFSFPKRSSTAYVGSGARIYDLCGKLLPSGLVSLMLGYRGRRDTCLLPGTVRDKVIGDGLEDMETIGKVPTYDVETGRPRRRTGDEEMGGGGFDGHSVFDGEKVWGGHCQQAQGGGAGDSATWEKV